MATVTLVHDALIERFMAKIEVLVPIRSSTLSGCWEWTAYRNADGYGIFSVGSRPVLAHRFSYEKFVGQIPEGKQLDHKCRNRSCVNPYHLEVVTNKENARRGETGIKGGRVIGKRMLAKTHCPRGHLYNEENTVIWADGKRRCRICQRARKRKGES